MQKLYAIKGSLKSENSVKYNNGVSILTEGGE